MRKYNGFILALASVFFSGCASAASFSTADYLGFTKSYVKVSSLETDKVQTSYKIHWNAANVAKIDGGYGSMDYSIYIARDWDSPIISRGITITDSEVKIIALTTATFPAKFESLSDFPDPDRDTFNTLKYDLTLDYGSVRFHPCIGRSGETNHSFHCVGAGLIEGSSMRSGKHDAHNLVSYAEVTHDEIEQTVADQIDGARVTLLPEGEQKNYIAWLGICPRFVQHADNSALSPIRQAAACSCTYLKAKDYVQTIIEYPDEAAPLGNGSDASRFQEIALACTDNKI